MTKKEPIKGFYPEFEIGEKVYFKVDEEARQWIVDGYRITGPSHDRLTILTRPDDQAEAYPYELTTDKPIF